MKTITVLSSDEKQIDGKEYFFIRSDVKGMIKQGTCARCDVCQKVCVSNEVGILAFEDHVEMIYVNKEIKDAPELAGYDERDDLVKCDECHNKGFES